MARSFDVGMPWVDEIWFNKQPTGVDEWIKKKEELQTRSWLAKTLKNVLSLPHLNVVSFFFPFIVLKRKLGFTFYILLKPRSDHIFIRTCEEIFYICARPEGENWKYDNVSLKTAQLFAKISIAYRNSRL